MEGKIFVRTLEIPIFYIDIIVIIHSNINEVDVKFKLGLKDAFYPDDPNECHAVTCNGPVYEDKSEIYVIFKPKFLSADTFAHELTHIMNFICIAKGMNPSSADDEPYAYLQGYVVKRLMEPIMKYMDDNSMNYKDFLTSKKI